MSPPTTLHLIRHGSHDLLGHALAGCRPGLSLNEAGRAQAVQIGASLTVDAVVSSPLERAQETARPLAARLGLPIEIEPDFTELDFGTWTGATFESLHGSAEWHAFNSFRSTAAIPNGETMLEAQTRALGVVRRLRRAHAGQAVAVFGHSDIIKGVLIHFLGMSLDLMHRIEVAPASRSVLLLGDDWATVAGVNLPVGG